MKAALFYILAIVMLAGSALTVSSSKLLRSAVYLLFVLIATAGLYFLMDYFFLTGVQLTLYAGGIIVLIIFSIMLTTNAGEQLAPSGVVKRLSAALLGVCGTLICIYTFTRYHFLQTRSLPTDSSVNSIGAQLVNAGRDGYLLPFELASILLLAAMVAAIVIARSDKST